MAASLQEVTPTAFTGNPGDHDCDLPATVNAGDLLLVDLGVRLASSISTPIQDSTGDNWTVVIDGGLNGGGRHAQAIKIADGDEDGGSVTITTNTGCNGAAHVARYAAGTWSGDLNDIEAANAAGSNSSPNPPSLSPSWGAEDNHWVATGAAADDDETFDSAPSGYGNLNSTVSGGGINNGSEVGFATLDSAVATEDPGTFALSGSEGWNAGTTVIRPAGGVTISNAIAAAVAGKAEPTTVLGSTSASPLAGAVAGRNGPTVILGSMTVGNPVAAAVAGKAESSVVLGSLMLSPTAEGVAGAAAPGIVLGPITLTPSQAEAIGARADPNVLGADVVISGALAEAIAEAIDPTAIGGASRRRGGFGLIRFLDS